MVHSLESEKDIKRYWGRGERKRQSWKTQNANARTQNR